MSGNRFTMTKKKQSFDEHWLIARVTIWNSVHTKAIVSSSSETAPQMKKDRRNTGPNISMPIDSSAERLGWKWTFWRLPQLFYSDYFDTDKLLCHRTVLDNFNHFHCVLFVYCRCILKVNISWQLDAGVFISFWTSYVSTMSSYFG